MRPAILKRIVLGARNVDGIDRVRLIKEPIEAFPPPSQCARIAHPDPMLVAAMWWRLSSTMPPSIRVDL